MTEGSSYNQRDDRANGGVDASGSQQSEHKRHVRLSATELQHGIERRVLHLRHRMEQSPYATAFTAGAIGLIAANALGVGEVAIAIGAGYAAFRLLRGRAGSEPVSTDRTRVTEAGSPG